ncbi:MAG: cation:proton antiporter [Pseudomonadota bacterium]
MQPNVLTTLFIIFTGSAVIATLVLYTRQSLLVAYILLGIIIGPYGLRWVSDSTLVTQASDLGIIFLLFLLGLNLHPQKLFHMLRKATLVAIISSLVFACAGYLVARLFHYNEVESLIVGAAMMFSSTIIGLKLLPTTILHHRHTGEVMISILLLQDILAIIVLLFVTGASAKGLSWQDLLLFIISLPTLLIIGYLAQRYVLVKLLSYFDHVKEYIFLLSIGWCLCMAELAGFLGLSEEIGAFIAGVSLAATPIALYISENLKPLRDFFLTLFFFTIGAGFNLAYLPEVIMPALILAVITLAFKPALFSLLLRNIGEDAKVSWEVGVRLGQSSEFSLLVAYLAVSVKNQLIGPSANYLIQAMTIITFIVSSYWVVLRYPTPLALTERMRRD